MIIGISLFAACAMVEIASKLASGVSENVDLIELNHFHDMRGRLVFEQVVFYERAPETGRFQVRAWCMVDDNADCNRRPVKNETTQLYQVDWLDTDHRLLRKITSRLYRESWTQTDPERDDQKRLPGSCRISLAMPKAILDLVEAGKTDKGE